MRVDVPGIYCGPLEKKSKQNRKKRIPYARRFVGIPFCRRRSIPGTKILTVKLKKNIVNV